MRRKKHKAVRKAVRFYRIQHGFRMPFKVLLDGNFMHNMLRLKMKSVEEVIPKLLGGTCRLFTTSCIQHELKNLGPDFRDTWRTSKKLLLYKCGHEAAPKAACDCITSLIGSDNHEHFFVATQDKAVKTALLKIPAGAVIQCGANGVHLLSPSDKQEKVAQESHKAAQTLNPEEQAALKPLLGKRPRNDAQLQYNDSKFVTKKAKAPNPLSCKQKQVKERVKRPKQADGHMDGQTDRQTRKGTQKGTLEKVGGAEGAMTVSKAIAGEAVQQGNGVAVDHRRRQRVRNKEKVVAV